MSDPSGQDPRQRAKRRLHKSIRHPVKRITKFFRRLRKTTARRISSRLPGLSRHIEEYRYRRRGLSNLAAEFSPPDFIIIGAPKCGTSWLQGILDQHPKVLLVPDEIEYFSSHYDYPIEWYLEHFVRRLAAVEGGEREAYILGEKSARYCAMSPERIRRVHELMPNARLILMTRDPVSRHWAHAKRYFQKRTFHKTPTAILDLPQDKIFEFFKQTRALGEFSTIIRNWREVFPNEQLLVVSQEKTLASPQVTFDAVLEHIGLPADYDRNSMTFLSKQRNRGPRIDMSDEVEEFLDRMFTHERQWLRDFFGDRQCVLVS